MLTMQTPHISDVLRNLRERHRITKYRLAQLTGLTQSYLGQLEKGRYIPSDETLRKLSEALNYDFEMLKAVADAERLGEKGVERIAKSVLMNIELRDLDAEVERINNQIGKGITEEEAQRHVNEYMESRKPWPLHDLGQASTEKSAQSHGLQSHDETNRNLSTDVLPSTVEGKRDRRTGLADFDAIPGLLPLVEVPVYGLVSCGAPDWTSEIPVSKILLPAMMLKGVTGAVVVSGESMVGVGFEEGDLLLLRQLDGEKPASGKKVIVNINGECSCKVYRNDGLGEYLEAVYADGPRRWPMNEQVRLVAVVVRSVKFSEE